MLRTTLARWLAVVTLAGAGLLPAGSAFAQSSDGSQQSIEGDTTASVVHDGDNEASANQAGQTRSGDSVAGGQVTGIVANGGSVRVTKNNTSEDSEATSGDATITNTASAQAGPQVVTQGACARQPAPVSIGGPDDRIEACVVHDGDNTADVSQTATSNTGDAVAGGQVSGIVTNGGDVSLDATNDSEGAEATSGDSISENDVTVLAGPLLGGQVAVGGATSNSEGDASGRSTDTGGLPLGGVAVLPAGGATASSIEGNPILAQVVHEGDNDAAADQNAGSTSGDAVAGSQIAGLVSSEGGTINVVNRQSSEDAEATTGDSTSDNDSGDTVLAGPFVAGASGLQITSIRGGDIISDIIHDGDNEASLSQNATSASGDAVAGSSVVGVVSTGGDVNITSSNTSEDDEATSGDATADNDVDVVLAGPIVSASGLTISSIRADGNIEATIVHEGDNTADVTQGSNATSGDAVAGGQIFGVVGTGGDVNIDATNTSEDAEATSGDANADSDLGLALAGPISAASVAITTVAPASIEADNINFADVVHDGDNDATVSQTATATSGDAVAGAQIFGVVGDGDANIVASNTSEDDEATTGNADADSDVDVVLAGPIVTGDGQGGVSASIKTDGSITADIVHEGDNEINVGQNTGATTGDAVAGGQVFGVVTTGRGAVNIDATNSSEDSEATSGEADALSFVDPALAGPLVTSSASGVQLTSIESGGSITANVVHDGDNQADANQNTNAASGDAVAGGQVFGVVASGTVNIVSSNTSEDAEANSGNADARSDIDNIVAGPIYSAGGVTFSSIRADGTINANIIHDGDNQADVGQTTNASTGDAVAGGAVFGVVSTGGTTNIDATNSSEDDEANSGNADSDSDVDNALAGPIIAQTATFASDSIEADFIVCRPAPCVVHDGDNDLGISQSTDATTGDAVAGGQVFGVVGAGDTSIVASNTSEDSEATSGDADSLNSVDNAIVGALLAPSIVISSIEGDNIDANVVHDGDNSLDANQSAASTSGDAVAGGQVAGIVTSAGGSVSADLTNTSEDAEAVSGDADSTNTIDDALVGPIVTQTGLAISSIEGNIIADVVQDGDNDLNLGQSLSTDSGDAVAGGQVLGVVASGDVEVTQTNSSEDDETNTGNGTGNNNLPFATAGPFVLLAPVP